MAARLKIDPEALGEAPGAGSPAPAKAEPARAARKSEMINAFRTAASEDEFEPWESQLYGAMVKSARKRAGYKTAQAFSDTIFRRTRVYISRDVLYKIEQGRQNPDIVQFMAINLSLYDKLLPDRVLGPCIAPEWSDIEESEGAIPLGWRNQNTLAVEAATGEKVFSDKDAARLANDDPKLFGYGTAEAPQ